MSTSPTTRAAVTKSINDLMVHCKFGGTEICFFPRNSIARIATRENIDAFIAGDRDKDQWSREELDSFADMVFIDSSKVFIVVAKNNWPAAFLYNLVVTHEIKDMHPQIHNHLEASDEWDVAGGLRDQLIDEMEMYDTGLLLMSCAFEKSFKRKDLPFTSVQEGLESVWDGYWPIQKEEWNYFSVVVHEDYIEHKRYGNRFHLLESKRRPLRRQENAAVSAFWAGDGQEQTYISLKQDLRPVVPESIL